MRKKGFNRHHIYPTSRLKGGNLIKICLTPAKEHNLYHQLVGNMTVLEAFDYFNKTFWDNSFTLNLEEEK
jgi:hypothetical protein